MQSFRFAVTAVAAVLAFALLSPCLLGQVRVEAAWDELTLYSGRKVSAALVDGALLTGSIVAVSDDGLRFRVKKTSNRDLYPRGKVMIPRSQLSAFSYQEMGRVLWRPLGTAIGAGAGSMASLPFWVTASGEGGLKGRNAGITVGAIGGLAAVGYLLGRQTDKRTVTVVITQR